MTSSLRIDEVKLYRGSIKYIKTLISKLYAKGRQGGLT